MFSYILMHIECMLFEGYCLFYQSSSDYAGLVSVKVANSVSEDKRDKITLEWDDRQILHTCSKSAYIRAKVFLPDDIPDLCHALADAFDLDVYSPEGRRKYLLIFSLMKGPANLCTINKMLMERWVFADKQ